MYASANILEGTRRTHPLPTEQVDLAASAIDVQLPGPASLTRRLANTDRLINQVAYKLCGLINDEIAVKEGKQEPSR